MLTLAVTSLYGFGCFPNPLCHIWAGNRHFNFHGCWDNLKDRADGKIEAVSYATKTIVELFDFSERMMPHRITLDGNVLKVEAPECLKVELGMFSREFVVSQILGESEVSTPEHQSTGGSPVIIPGPGLDSGNMSEHDSRTTPGEQLLYLRIPADVDVQSKNPITFVEGGVRLE